MELFLHPDIGWVLKWNVGAAGAAGNANAYSAAQQPVNDEERAFVDMMYRQMRWEPRPLFVPELGRDGWWWRPTVSLRRDEDPDAVNARITSIWEQMRAEHES